MKRSGAGLVALAVLAWLVTGVPAHGAPPRSDETIVLSASSTVVRWEGVVGGPLLPGATECLGVNCAELDLQVVLPRGVHENSSDLQIAIAWEDDDVDLDLHVTTPRGGRASSTSLHTAQGQAVRVSAVDGEHRIQVVNDSVSPFALGKTVPYRGIAALVVRDTGSSGRELLPDLAPLPPTNIKLATGTAVPGSAYVAARHGVPGSPLSCYPEETARTGATRCLRFDQGVANFGHGPLELRVPPVIPALTGTQMHQRVYAGDGSWSDHPLPATAEFHPAHGHVHYPQLMEARLVGLREGKRRTLARGKTGFCLTDVVNLRFDEGGGEPRSYGFPDSCSFPRLQHNDAADDDGLVSGISPGWADVYGWYLPDQYLDVTNVPDGEYVLELEVNLEHERGIRGIREMATGNNVRSVRIALRANTVTVLP